MALREKLTPPLVVGPAEQHTHTVIFLHHFSAETTDEEFRSKVLSAKMTKNHKTLAEQFPTVRWVFPYPKAHGGVRAWANLSQEDKHSLCLTRPGIPYITQIILQEAERVVVVGGGLDRIILGGQGETAEAAHEAMGCFPQPPPSTALGCEDPQTMAKFIQQTFHHPTWTGISQMKLAGFVGMHAQDGHLTRDVRDYGIMSKSVGGGGPIMRTVNNTIITNTPHKFINGGYKLQTTTWDGRRIDEFAEFLASLGVPRINHEDANRQQGSNKESLAPRDRGPKAKFDLRDTLSEKQKYALEIVQQKAAAEKEKERILIRIEADKVERKLRQERERQVRLYRKQAQRRPTEGPQPRFHGGVARLGDARPPGSFGPDVEDVTKFEEPFWDQEEENEGGDEEGFSS